MSHGHIEYIDRSFQNKKVQIVLKNYLPNGTEFDPLGEYFETDVITPVLQKDQSKELKTLTHNLIALPGPIQYFNEATNKWDTGKLSQRYYIAIPVGTSGTGPSNFSVGWDTAEHKLMYFILSRRSSIVLSSGHKILSTKTQYLIRFQPDSKFLLPLNIQITRTPTEKDACGAEREVCLNLVYEH